MAEADKTAPKIMDLITSETTIEEFGDLVRTQISPADRKLFGDDAEDLIANALVNMGAMAPSPADFDRDGFGGTARPEEYKLTPQQLDRMIEISKKNGVIGEKENGRLYIDPEQWEKANWILEKGQQLANEIAEATALELNNVFDTGKEGKIFAKGAPQETHHLEVAVRGKTYNWEVTALYLTQKEFNGFAVILTGLGMINRPGVGGPLRSVYDVNYFDGVDNQVKEKTVERQFRATKEKNKFVSLVDFQEDLRKDWSDQESKSINKIGLMFRAVKF